MNDGQTEYLQREQKKALLVLLSRGGTVVKSTSGQSSLYRLMARGAGDATVPAGVVHELVREGMLQEKRYPHQTDYVLTSKGRSKSAGLQVRS